MPQPSLGAAWRGGGPAGGSCGVTRKAWAWGSPNVGGAGGWAVAAGPQKGMSSSKSKRPAGAGAPKPWPAGAAGWAGALALGVIARS